MSWQRCPLCQGTGYNPNAATSAASHNQCPTCQGHRIIHEGTGLPPRVDITGPGLTGIGYGLGDTCPHCGQFGFHDCQGASLKLPPWEHFLCSSCGRDVTSPHYCPGRTSSWSYGK